MSKASDIAAAITARLAQISIANGYHTDIGLRVFRGKRDLDEPDAPCCVLVESDDSVAPASASRNTKVIITADYAIEALLACDPDHPNDAAHLAITDLKRALFNGDPSYGKLINKGLAYTGRVIEPRESGSGLVGVQVKVQAEFVEELMNP